MRYSICLILLYISIVSCNKEPLPQNTENSENISSPFGQILIKYASKKDSFLASYIRQNDIDNPNNLDSFKVYLYLNALKNMQSGLIDSGSFSLRFFSKELSKTNRLDSMIYIDLLNQTKFSQNQLNLLVENEHAFTERNNSFIDTYFQIRNYHFISTKCRYKGKSELAISFLIKALNILKKQQLETHLKDEYVQLNVDLAVNYLDRYDWEKAQEHLVLAINWTTKYNSSNCIKTNALSILSLTNYMQDNFEEAENNLREAISIKSNNLCESFGQQFYGEYFFAKGDLEKSKKAFKKSISLFDIEHSQIRRSLDFLSNCYLIESNIDSSKYFWNLAVNDDYLNRKSTTNSEKYKFLNTKSDICFLECQKSKSLKKCYAAIDYITQIESIYDNEMSIEEYFHYSDVIASLTERKLKVFLWMQDNFEISDSIYYLIQVQFTRSKYRSLKSTLNRVASKVSLVNDEGFEIATLLSKSENLCKPEKLTDQDIDYLISYFLSKEDSKVTLDRLGKDVYDQRKESTLSDLLSRGYHVLDLFQGEDALYVLSLTLKRKKLMRIPIDDLDEVVANLNQLIGSKRDQNLKHTLHRLYNFFLNGSIEAESKDLIILPDGITQNIPFDALIQDTASTLAESKFLIEDYNISITPDLDFLNYKNTSNTVIDNVSFCVYSDDKTQNLTDTLFSELRYSYQEAKNIIENSDFNNVELISGKKLKAKAFKAQFSKDLLHFAGHSVSGKKSYLDNYLVVRDSKNKPQKIYAHELKYIPSNLKHVVLSSCESGVGEYVIGEGVFSLSRSFLENGTPSVCKSLWKVNDQYTAEFMEEYYKQLQLHPVSEAMRQTKLNMIKNSRPSLRHPKYWAAFVVEGDPFMKLEF